MEKTKILFVSQEITPYLPETQMSVICRNLPQQVQENGMEIRTFMPKFGLINERRNQLHEVIRLSGMNLIIDDTDHPLIIKVASIQAARMQVYFIDNEDYFQRKAMFHDEDGKLFDDNDERLVFFARGVIETVKKLRWAPDVIHCHGWLSSLIPIYIKKSLQDDPLFYNSKVIYSVYKDNFSGSLGKKLKKKMLYEGITEEDIKILDRANYTNLSKLAIEHSDAIIFGSKDLSPELKRFIKKSDKQTLSFKDDESYSKEYIDLYNELTEDKEED